MVIIAGPNGAGKSTFYDLVIKDDPLMKNAPFINMDNIAKEISEPDENPNDNMLSAGKITYEEVEKHLFVIHIQMNCWINLFKGSQDFYLF